MTKETFNIKKDIKFFFGNFIKGHPIVFQATAHVNSYLFIFLGRSL